MSWCLAQCCAGCCEQAWEEHKIWKAEARSIAACQAGDLLELIPDNDDDEDESDLDFEEGDRLFAASINPQKKSELLPPSLKD